VEPDCGKESEVERAHERCNGRVLCGRER